MVKSGIGTCLHRAVILYPLQYEGWQGRIRRGGHVSPHRGRADHKSCRAPADLTATPFRSSSSNNRNGKDRNTIAIHCLPYHRVHKDWVRRSSQALFRCNRPAGNSCKESFHARCLPGILLRKFLIAPNKGNVVSSSIRRKLPLGLRRQPLTGPLRIRHGIVPADLQLRDGLRFLQSYFPALSDGASLPGLPLPPHMAIVQSTSPSVRLEHK